MMAFLPTLNALLNSLTVLFLLLGYSFIRRKKVASHKLCMLSAAVTSAVFLTSYLYYHAHHGLTRLQGQGLIRPLYFSILTTHTLLAAVQVPLILTTLFHAFRGNFEKHRRIARLTYPVWLYVSVTGVVVYWILYRMNF